MGTGIPFKKSGGRVWLSLAVLCAGLLVFGYLFLGGVGAGGSAGGLEPDAPPPSIASEPGGFALLEVDAETQRQAHREMTDVVEPAVVAPIDWKGAELKPWPGLVLSTLGAEPLADSLVEFRCKAGVVQATTDADGRFEMVVPPGIQGLLTASHDGYLDRAKPNVFTGTQVSMLLMPCASIRGTYAGEPTGLEAKLLALDSTDPAEPVATVPLTEEGTFHFADLKPGQFSIRVGPGVYAILKHVPLEAGEQREVHLTPLEPTQSLEGQVVLKPGGGPVADASIEVSYHTIGIPKALERDTETFTSTDKEGRFEVFLGSGVRTSVRVVAPWGGEKSLPYLDAEEWLKRGTVEVQMPAPGQLSGTVIDSNGEGVAAAALVLIKAPSGKDRKVSAGESPRPIGVALTDSDGKFDFGDVPTQESLLILSNGVGAHVSGFAPEQVLVQLKLKPGQKRTDLRLRVGLMARMTGTILDRRDEPVAGVRVDVSNATGQSVASTTSDALGNYSLENVPSPGSNQLMVELRMMGEVLHAERLKLPRRARGNLDVLEFPKDFQIARKSPVQGWVLDDEGYGVEGARLYLTRQKGRKQALGDGVSGPAGEFRFLVSEVQEGTVQLALRSRAWQLPKTMGRDLAVPLPDPLILRVERAAIEAGAQVRGEVLVGDSNQPVSRLRVQNSRGGVLTTEGTRFSLRGIRPGRLRLALRANGMAYHQLPAVDLTPGQDMDLGVIRMHRGCDLTLEIEGVKRNLPKGSKIRLKSLSKYEWDPQWKALNLDLNKGVKAKGSKAVRLQRRGIARGRWRLEVQVPGFKKHTQDLKLWQPRAKFKVKLKRP
ncbi:MAG: carboxypeptidase-like regulatory domain-containing protein [Planctomycetota bacterium]|nr:carboxypeptidase-like regulatory domain-containing protein [Planctomycetota bacterium]